jgi:hypothetical protein
MAAFPQRADYLPLILQSFNPCGNRRLPKTHCPYLRQCNQLDAETKGAYICAPRLTYEAMHELNNGREPQETQRWLLTCLQAYIDKKTILQFDEAWAVRTLNEGRLEALAKELFERAQQWLSAGLLAEEAAWHVAGAWMN